MTRRPWRHVRILMYRSFVTFSKFRMQSSFLDDFFLVRPSFCFKVSFATVPGFLFRFRLNIFLYSYRYVKLFKLLQSTMTVFKNSFSLVYFISNVHPHQDFICLVIEPRISTKAELKSPPFPFPSPAPSQFPTT